jgi:flagellin-specific chaperone FliS
MKNTNSNDAGTHLDRSIAIIRPLDSNPEEERGDLLIALTYFLFALYLHFHDKVSFPQQISTSYQVKDLMERQEVSI